MGDPPSQIDRINAGLDRLEQAIEERSAEDDMRSIDALLLQHEIHVPVTGDYWLGPETSS